MFDFKIVILDSPYDQLHDPRVRQILNDTMQMKIDGFKTGFPDGVLPIDSADMVATHLLVCAEYGEKLLPVCGFKVITPDVASKHRIEFPLLSLLKSSNAFEHYEHVKEKISKLKDKVVWGYSYTFLPSIRKDREVVNKVKDILTAVNYHFLKEIGCRLSYVSGVVKYKTDLYFKEAGYMPCSSNQEELPTIEQFSLWGEVVQLMEMEEFGEKSLFVGKTYQKLWDERIVFSMKNKKNLKEAA